MSKSGHVTGVLLTDGTEIHSKLVLSNATAKVTFIDLLDKVSLLCRLVSDLAAGLGLFVFAEWF